MRCYDAGSDRPWPQFQIVFMNEHNKPQSPKGMEQVQGLVSVVIPGYDCDRSICDVLDGVLSQTYPNIEIILVNDASPDDLDKVVQPYLQRIKHYVRNERNLGLSKTYNVGIRRARGEYILTLHSDCVLEPCYVEKLLKIIEKDPMIAVVTGQYLFKDFDNMQFSDKLFTAINLLPVQDMDSDSSGETDISFIEGKADLFRRAVLEKYGLFNENLSLTAEDQYLSVRMRKGGYRIVQDCRYRFAVKFSYTQDSIWKVLNKQRTYARGQSYVLVEHGFAALRSTTRNRNLRAMHRAGQLLYVGCLAALITLSFYNTRVLTLLAAVVLLRCVYYYLIAWRLRSAQRIITAFAGNIGDILYVIGFVHGTFRGIFRKRGVM